VLVTALNSREERVTGIQAGADDFLSKPVSREELLARVNSLVRLTLARKALEHERLAAGAAKTERMRSTFERYMAPKLVEQILSTPDAGEILMTSDVARTVPDLPHALDAEQMNPVDLKGTDQPVAYFRVTREACTAREMTRMSDTGRLVISMAGAK